MTSPSATQIALPGAKSKAIADADRMVVKRDGSLVRFNRGKILRAVSLAFYEVQNSTHENPYRDEPLACYGLDSETVLVVNGVVDNVCQMIELDYRVGKNPSIEEVQNVVEKAIALSGNWEVARAFMIYRAEHNIRRLAPYQDNGGLGDYIAISKYARHRKDLGRRETFIEGVRRVRDMHLAFFANRLPFSFPKELSRDVARLAGDNSDILMARLGGKTLAEVINETFKLVEEKRILPSMRSMQFGGQPILKNHARLFNCSFSNVDRVDFFKEFFFLLLAGTGCGFSVQKHHISQLPSLPTRGNEYDLKVRHHIVEDTIEGWADAVGALIQSYYNHEKVEFSYTKIRPRGAALVTSGGKAPGHLPLKEAITKCEAILNDASGRKLRPIEVYDICMHVSGAVLSGGIRRSATICLFSPDDEEMMTAKTGNWFDKHPHRSASNNSAVLNRNADNREFFNRCFKAMQEFGEPGFFFCDNPDGGSNPCCEIGCMPVIEGLTEQDVSRLYEIGYQGDLPATTRLSGWQFCNLSTINGASITNVEDFLTAVIGAAVVGTLQAAYSHMPYLSAVTQLIHEKDRLLGVSICGFMDNPTILFDRVVLREAARLARATNRMVAAMLGIRHAARVTCVKPEGTASLLLGAASGIHPHHARHYFRRVQANRNDPLYRHFQSINPQMAGEVSVYRPQTDDVLTFPVTAPKSAILREDINASQFLDYVDLVQTEWVLNGADEESRSPDIMHNVSNTVTVKDSEWEIVCEKVWGMRQRITGLSFLAASGDKTYRQAPREEVREELDVLKWNSLQPKRVDWTALSEREDATKLAQEIACAGGKCEIA
jgi:ribonucleoside-triphosphate reductase (thioredoxin)